MEPGGGESLQGAVRRLPGPGSWPGRGWLAGSDGIFHAWPRGPEGRKRVWRRGQHFSMERKLNAYLLSAGAAAAAHRTGETASRGRPPRGQARGARPPGPSARRGRSGCAGFVVVILFFNEKWSSSRLCMLLMDAELTHAFLSGSAALGGRGGGRRFSEPLLLCCFGSDSTCGRSQLLTHRSSPVSSQSASSRCVRRQNSCFPFRRRKV